MRFNEIDERYSYFNMNTVDQIEVDKIFESH